MESMFPKNICVFKVREGARRGGGQNDWSLANPKFLKTCSRCLVSPLVSLSFTQACYK